MNASEKISFQYEEYSAWTTAIEAINERGQSIGRIVYEKKSCYLSRLQVVSKMQRRGIGTQLFIRAMRDMQSSCELVNFRSTHESVGFYLRLGARVTIPDPDLDEDEARVTTPMHYNLR